MNPVSLNFALRHNILQSIHAALYAFYHPNNYRKFCIPEALIK